MNDLVERLNDLTAEFALSGYDHRKYLVSEAVGEISRLRRLNAELVEALDRVTDCERYTRVGGATEGDLGSYERGLDEAIQIAIEALSRAKGEA